MRISYLSLIFLLTCTLLACKSEKNNDQKTQLIQAGEETEVKVDSAATRPAVVVDPSAPKRITRNVKRMQSGALIIAAYDDVIIYDGNSFKPLEKSPGMASWYAFDALEASNGDIWVASDQSGAYRIDSKTGEVAHFTPKDGLGHLRNMVVYEDRGGTIWVGGQGGLSRFNGGGFETFTTDNGLPHNDVNTLMEDSSGILWIGTRGNAGFYDGDYFMELQNDRGEPFFNVWSIIEDSSGTIWLVDDKGLWKFQYGHFAFVSQDAWKIYERLNKDLILTALFPGARSALKQIPAASTKTDSLEIETLFQSETMLFGVVEDLSGNLWIGGGDGIWRYKNQEMAYFTGNLK